MLQPVAVFKKARVLPQVGLTEFPAKDLKLPAVAHGQEYVALSRGKRLVRRDIRMRIPCALGNFSAHKVIGGMGVKQRNGTVEERDVQKLPFATGSPLV